MCTSVSKSESPGVGGSHQSAARKTERPGSPVLTANVLKGVVAANATFDQSTVTVSHSSGVVGQLCVVSLQRSCSILPLIWGKKANFYLELYEWGYRAKVCPPSHPHLPHVCVFFLDNGAPWKICSYHGG